jgi:hypothetical protein
MRSKLTFLCSIALLALVCPGTGGQAADRRAVDETEVAALIRDLRSDDEGVRFKACKALGKLGPEARAALPALTRLATSDPDEDVRRVARTACGAIRTMAAPGGARRPAGKPVSREELLASKWCEVNIAGMFAMRFDKDGTVSGAVPGVVEEMVLGTWTYEGNVLEMTFLGPVPTTETYHLTWQSRPNLIVAEQKGVLGGRELWKRVP